MTTDFVLLDSARMGILIEKAWNLNPVHDSLFRGKSEENLRMVAPYIFSVEKNEAFKEWYLAEGWGHSWGVLVGADGSMKELHHHFRKFLLVKTEDRKELYFRFYDPRVLKSFLPTCDAPQILEFFGPVKYFIVEGDTKKEAVRFWQENGLLKQLTVSVDEIFSSKVM
jgi:hypothetical protein